MYCLNIENDSYSRMMVKDITAARKYNFKQNFDVVTMNSYFEICFKNSIEKTHISYDNYHLHFMCVAYIKIPGWRGCPNLNPD